MFLKNKPTFFQAAALFFFFFFRMRKLKKKKKKERKKHARNTFGRQLQTVILCGECIT